MYRTEVRSFLVMTADERLVTAARGNALLMMCRAPLAQVQQCALVMIG
jgi:hypothetical protein